MLGSVGVADLAPLADLAHGLFGDLPLEANEGLALVNNNAFSTALAALALTDAARLLRSLTVAGALDLEGFGANLSTLDPAVDQVRAHTGERAELADLRATLDGSRLWSPGEARHLQDPLAFRSIVPVHGAARDAVTYAGSQLDTELNAHQHNPLVLGDRDEVLSGAGLRGAGGVGGARPGTHRAGSGADQCDGAHRQAAAGAALGAPRRAGRGAGCRAAGSASCCGRRTRSPSRCGCWRSRCRTSSRRRPARRGSPTGSPQRRSRPAGCPSRWASATGSSPSVWCARRRPSTCVTRERSAGGPGACTQASGSGSRSSGRPRRSPADLEPLVGLVAAGLGDHSADSE